MDNPVCSFGSWAFSIFRWSSTSLYATGEAWERGYNNCIRRWRNQGEQGEWVTLMDQGERGEWVTLMDQGERGEWVTFMDQGEQGKWVTLVVTTTTASQSFNYCETINLIVYARRTQ